MKIIKIILGIMLVLLISGQSFATQIDWDEDIQIIREEPENTNIVVSIPEESSGFDFVHLPIYIHDTRLNLELGDVLFSEDSATLVALDSYSALYLDFNVPYGDTAQYKSTGKVDGFIEQVLRSDYSNIEKQFIIWKYFGVEEAALRIAWLRAYVRDVKEYETLFKSKLFKEAAKKKIGINLKDAINKRRIEADYKANGYSSITMSIDAYADSVVNIPLGQKFDNAEGSNQDLGVAEPVTIYVPKSFLKTIRVKSYCINAHKGVPKGNDELQAASLVEDNVKSTIVLNYATAKASTTTSQSMVWQETDGDGADYDLEDMGITESELSWIKSEDKTNDDNTDTERGFYSNLLRLFARLKFW